jgi:hypothetical protein
MKKLIALMMAGVMMIGTSVVVFANDREERSDAGVEFVGIPDIGIIDPENPPTGGGDGGDNGGGGFTLPDNWGLVSMNIHFGIRNIMQMAPTGFNNFASTETTVGQNALTEAIPANLQTIDLGVVTPRAWTLNVSVGEFTGANNIDDFGLVLTTAATHSQLGFSTIDAPGINPGNPISPTPGSGPLVASGSRGVFGLQFSGVLSLLTARVEHAGESTAVITWTFNNGAPTA